MKRLPQDIAEMDARIAALKDKKNPPKRQSSTVAKYLQNALRIATEFVSPIFIGICIGYLLDKCFDTRIIFMLILAIFGLLAGMQNVYRAAKQMDKDISGSK